MKITILGAGAWGTALAYGLDQGGHEISLWGHDAEHLEEMRQTGRNERYLPGIDLPSTWSYEPDLTSAIGANRAVVMAVPSKAVREVSRQLSGYGGILVSVTKGIEYETGLTMCAVLEQNAPQARLAALSGPSLAREVALGIPTAIVAASLNAEVAQEVQAWFHRPAFRVYTSVDLLGVELGGALKNVVAIAAGVGDGLGFGDNSKAALITRAMVEIRRLGVACGAQAETFWGLSGLGDLTVTCFSKLSRNRTFGEHLGRGGNLEAILAGSVSIVEGYPTARSARQLSEKLKLNTPIIDEVYALLYEGKSAAKAVADLTQRETKPEDGGQ
jgi:glycerol-3-phosphate dehydrogenase (NAD(P)+)